MEGKEEKSTKMRTIDCSTVESLIKAWLDGELEPPRDGADNAAGREHIEGKEVEKHVASCVACAATARDYREISQALGSLAEERAPLPLIEAIEARARGMEREEKIMVRSLQRVAALAAAVLMVALGTLLWSSSQHVIDPTAVSSGGQDGVDSVMAIVLGDPDWEDGF